ncbi:MAG: efflux RND transporter permease subunit [Deltaproteobacteria bacterium]|jgi:cobalt-zinc-cadmium resistance protein CzcA|nr:efflux RND transporter permease subunit [Deltaproteobacteria bacterium]
MSTENPQQGIVAQIVRLSFARPLLVLIAVVVGTWFGADALRSLNRDVFPDLSTPVFNVIVQNPAMGAEELEAAITVPMEVALGGLPDVRRVRSTSTLGVASVVIEFEADADYQRARQLVAERIGSVALPPNTEPPLLSSLSGRLNEVFEFTLEAAPGTVDLMTLRDLAEFEVKNRLLAVPGVAAVERLGGYLREFQVQLDPERMTARGVTLEEVLHAAAGANQNTAGGILTDGSVEWTVRAVGQVQTIEELRGTTVVLRGGTPVLLGDIADVVEAPAVRRGIAHRLDGEVVSCRVSKQFGADTVAVTAGLRDALDDIVATLPAGVTARVVYDQSELVDEALGGVTRAVLLGALMVVLVLFALLGDARAAALVTLSIPLSVAISGVLLEQAGIGLNTMTLGGLAIAVGLLVDASIIVTENVLHRLKGTAPSEREGAAVLAAIEVGRPIAFATLIVVVVFLPLFTMHGLEGKTYRPLAAAVIAAMTAALALALTLTPLVAARVLRPSTDGADHDTALIRWFKRVYAPVLDAGLRRPGAVLLLSIALAVPGLLLGAQLGRDFMPELDEGAFLVQTFLPGEASLDEVDRLNHRVEDQLRQVPEVLEVSRRTGRAERTEDPMPHTISDVLVLLRPERTRPLSEIEDDVRDRLASVPGVNAAVTTPLGMRIDEGLGGTPADVSIKVFGDDLTQLAALGAIVREKVEGIEGLTDLRVEEITGLPQVKVVVDRAAAGRVGLTPGDVIEALRVGLVGEVVSEVRVGQRRYDLVVRLPDHRRGDINALRALLVDGHDGSRIPLGKLAEISQTVGPSAIKREAGSRRIAIEGSVVGRDLGAVADEVNVRLKGLTLPTGSFISVGGRIESQERASAALVSAVAVAVAGVFVLLLLALGTAWEAATILLTLPVALVGGVLALWITGETWNVSSMVGIIGLFGIAVQNGLVLVSQVRGLREEGLDELSSLREASLGRVRPKLMTAGTAVLGLLPILVLNLRGTEIERPLAIVMTGGLVTSTLFTLIALPAVYRLVEGWLSRRGAAP